MFDDGALVAQAKAGDFGAFDQLVSRHERRLYALVRNMVRTREDAEDVVQTAFLSALENLDGFREEASFGTWVSRIATHAALKVIRKGKGLDTVPLEEEPTESYGEVPHPEYIADWTANPAVAAEQGEMRRILDEAIATLPEKHRLVFILRDVTGLSVAETAEALAITEVNVKVRLLRARLALREKLTRIFGDPSTQVAPDHAH